MASRFCLFGLMCLLSVAISREDSRQLVVWNVGQGQWATVIDGDTCWHFDLGGEFAPWAEILRACRSRHNRVTLSHWDWDHIGFLGRARMHLPDMCLLRGRAREFQRAQGPPDRRFTALRGSKLAVCGVGRRREQECQRKQPRGLWRGILLPGDSSRDQEKFWVRDLKPVRKTRILVLGHHGSATSTGKELLAGLPGLALGIASAREGRYGHPHRRVRADLARLRVPLLRTEDWGTIRVDLRDY